VSKTKGELFLDAAIEADLELYILGDWEDPRLLQSAAAAAEKYESMRAQLPADVEKFVIIRKQGAENAKQRERQRKYEAGHPHWQCQNKTCAVLNRCHVDKCTACGTEAPELALLRQRAAKVEGLESSLRRMQEERDEARRAVAFLQKVSADKDVRIESLELSFASNSSSKPLVVDATNKCLECDGKGEYETDVCKNCESPLFTFCDACAGSGVRLNILNDE
jgi:hypothetical protein